MSQWYLVLMRNHQRYFFLQESATQLGKFQNVTKTSHFDVFLSEWLVFRYMAGI